MKILILGHGRHGKDTVAQYISEKYGLKFISSSRAVFEEAVWPHLCGDYIDWGGTNIEEAKMLCFEDRINRRAEWKKLISDYNTPDKAALAKIILSKNDMYVGMRCEHEYEASKHLFDKIFWVHRIGYMPEPEMTITMDLRTMIPLVNTGHLEKLYSQIRKGMEQ
jgi:adenylate kinase family enzyme